MEYSPVRGGSCWKKHVGKNGVGGLELLARGARVNRCLQQGKQWISMAKKGASKRGGMRKRGNFRRMTSKRKEKGQLRVGFAEKGRERGIGEGTLS